MVFKIYSRQTRETLILCSCEPLMICCSLQWFPEMAPQNLFIKITQLLTGLKRKVYGRQRALRLAIPIEVQYTAVVISLYKRYCYRKKNILKIMFPHHNILNVRMLRYNVLEHPKTSVAFALRSSWAGGNYSPL